MADTLWSFDPAPRQLDAILDPAWLSAMLAQRWPGARVVGVETVETIVTIATKVRLKLTVEGPGDIPQTVCIKGVLVDAGGNAAASIVETLFYQHAAATIGVRVPDCHYAGLNADGDNGIIVMQDQIAAGGRFCTALEPFSADQAFQGLAQLAKLHVAGHSGTSLYKSPWIPRFLDRITVQPIMPLDILQTMLDGERGLPLDPEIRSAERLQRGLDGLAAQIRERENCLVHGDAHAGNIYRNAAGEVGIVDWQVLQQGEWAQDIAYHLATVLTPEDRRTHERALLNEYRAHLRTLGGPDLDPDEAWTRYRAAMIYGYYLWSITRKVDPVITNEFVRRLGCAVSDLDSFHVVCAAR